MSEPVSKAADPFMRLARNLQAGDIDFSANQDGSDEDLDVEKLIADKPLPEANSVSSRVTRTEYKATETDSLAFNGYTLKDTHKVVIDLDMDAALWETSTPGHHHLIIDHEMTWATYERLLFALNAAGLIQDGYLNACIARKASWVRTPWTRKGN